VEIIIKQSEVMKMTNLLIETINEMLTEAYKLNYKVIAVKPFNHPQDDYMVKCVVVNHKLEAVSYIFNRGFNLGHYFGNELDAVADMNER
jgi:hypothetical protein